MTLSLRSLRDPILVAIGLVALWQVLHQIAGDSAVTAPAPVAGNYDIGLADFGPSASSTFLSGRLALAIDEATAEVPATTDACTALTNASAIAGRFAVVDRDDVGFAVECEHVGLRTAPGRSQRKPSEALHELVVASECLVGPVPS